MPGKTASAGTGGQAAFQSHKQKEKAAENGKEVVKALPWSPVVQGQVSSLPIVFTHDAEFFFVVASSSIKIHSRATGQLVSTLSSAASTSSQSTWSGRQVGNSHTAAITGLCINPANELQLLSCSLDGTIKVWDYLDALLLKTIDLGFPITHMVAHASIKGSVYVALRKPKNTGPSEAKITDHFQFNGRCNSIIQLVSLSTAANKGRQASRPQSVTRVGKARQTTSIGLSSDGRFLVLIGKRKIHFARSDALQDGFSKVISDHELTCLAFHPESSAFATGDSTGQIRLWHFLDDQQQKGGKRQGKGVQIAPSVLMHWHSHAVSALTFTPNGANLLSGGEESVMVLWQLSTQNREYVPRLGGSRIESLSVLEGKQGREEEYVASLGDGSISFIGAINLKTNRTISLALVDASRLLLGSEYLSKLPCFPLAVQPGSNHVVTTAGHPSTLQFLDVEADRLVSQIEVVPSNRVSRPDEVALEPPRVETVCFSEGGEWMATTDVRGTGETSLKVWQWNAKTQAYSLNSRIDQPHGKGRVTSMAFNPRGSSPLLLTTGSDRQARTWRVLSQKVKGAREEQVWVARSTFDYRRVPIASASWEPNGSLLALAHDDFVTLWEPLSNSLQAVVSVSGLSRGVAFAGKAGRYLVAASDSRLVVWDIVMGQMSWEREMQSLDHIVLDGQNRFSVLSTRQSTTLVRTYSPASSTALHSHRLAFTLRQVCSNGTGEESTPHFYALTASFDVICAGVGAREEVVQQGQTAQSLHGASVKRRTLYDELIGPRETATAAGTGSANETVGTAWHDGKAGKKEADELLDMPSHLLPPMSVLYEPLMQQWLPKRAPIQPVEDEQGSEDEMNEEDREGGEGADGLKSSSLDRCRRVFDMEWSGMTELFAKQATISPATPNHRTADTGTRDKSADARPVKHAQPAKQAQARSSAGLQTSPKSAASPSQGGGSGRKRKTVY